MRRFSSSPDDRRRDQYRDHHGSSRPNRRYDRSDRHEPYQRYNARYDADYSPQRPPDRSRGRNRNADRRNVDRRNTDRRNADRNRRPEGEPMLGRLIRVEYDRGFAFIRPQRSKVDIFVHFSEFKNVHPEETNIGDTMEFYLKEGGSKKDKAVFAMRTKAFIPVEQQIEAATFERGIVVAARATSGTISRLEEARDVRFEYDDMQVRRSRPRTGDSVEFKVVELPEGKAVAVAVRILPRGTVSLEVELEPRRQATVTVIQLQQQRQKKFAHGRSGRGGGRRADSDPQYRGKLVLQESAEADSGAAGGGAGGGTGGAAAAAGGAGASGAPKRVGKSPSKALTHPFLSSDVVGEIVLGVGDVVSVSLMQHKRTKKIRVAKVVLQQLGGQRETGVVHTTRDAFGFIECCEREAQIFFHYSELLPELSALQEDGAANNPRRRMGADKVPQNGQEVSFQLQESAGKSPTKSNIKAVRVLPLPRGSVSFETLVQADCVGEVVRGIKPNFSFRRDNKNRKDSYNRGTVTLLDAEAIKALGDDSFQAHASVESMISADVNFPFSGADVSSDALRLARRNSLVARDVVHFDLVLQKRTKRHTAAHVRLVRAAPEFESVGGEWSGLVAVECQPDAGARSSSRRDWGNNVAKGEISLDKLQVGLDAGDTAIKSIVYKNIFFTIDVPVSTKANSDTTTTTTAAAAPNTDANAGADSNADPATQPPTPPDTSASAQPPTPPDTSTFLRYNSAVRVVLKRRIADKSLWVDRIISYTEAPRVDGVVVQVRETYGFVRCKQNKRNVYFSFKDVLPDAPPAGSSKPAATGASAKPKRKLRSGDKVTFFLTSGAKDGGRGGNRNRDSPSRRSRAGRGEEELCAVQVMRVPEKVRPRFNLKLKRANSAGRQRTAKGPPSDGSIGFKLVRTVTADTGNADTVAITDAAATDSVVTMEETCLNETE